MGPPGKKVKQSFRKLPPRPANRAKEPSRREPIRLWRKSKPINCVGL